MTQSWKTRAHRGVGLALIAAASVLAFLAIFAFWVNRQALNTDNFTDSSTSQRASANGVSAPGYPPPYATFNGG